ncbi:AI-2E family transporter [Sutcliffiella horikoshii]|uniref:AI-2E family transporter n=1 Tax=Sutcliffiella horikoshii TaxID=79883 RepID=UPI00203CAB06|nr:AI-2E family transporter [Sutcliffiella horikoshii]MCM3618559.1 AI-2E family transporter [Sutcliffiella horikoshii]
MSMWIRHPFFKYATGIILVLLIIFLLSEVKFIVNPIISFITTLFFPIIFAGFLFYILKPLVNFLARSKYMPRTLAIILIFSAIIGGAVLGGFSVGGNIEEQVVQFADDFPSFLEENEEQTKELIDDNNLGLISYEEIKKRGLAFLKDQTQRIGDNIATIVSSVTNFVTILVIVPFILFYFLKDGHKLLPFILKMLPGKHQVEGKRLLTDIDKTLSTYIVGQMLVALVNGFLMYIGYLVIGLDYALVLALFIVITAVVPIIGPALGILPAVIIGLMTDPMMVVKILILLTVVQQIEGNLVSPQILGNKLSIHPLTVILLLLAAGKLYGFIGILLAVPVYSVLKVVTKNLFGIYRLRKA